jgi:predicted ATPase
MHLLERDQQLRALAEYADDVRRGKGRLVLVSGEAGVGKSSLLEAFECALTGRPVGLGRLRRRLHAGAPGAAR